MALKVKYQLPGAEPVIYIDWKAMASKDGARMPACFTLRHPKQAGEQKARIESVPADKFSFYANLNNLRCGWQEGYRPNSTKPPIRKPDRLPLVAEGFPEPPEGWEDDEHRVAKNGWKALYHLEAFMPDGRRAVIEVSSFGGRRLIEQMWKAVELDATTMATPCRCSAVSAPTTRTPRRVVPSSRAW